MTESEKINGWTFEETVKTAENLMEEEQNMFKWDVLRHLRDFAETYKEELQQYRAIGTVSEFREAMFFKKYFMELYGEGLEVANWHQNGDLEPLDNFIDEAFEWGKEKEREEHDE